MSALQRNSVSRTLSGLLLSLTVGAVVVALDETPDGLEITLISYLEHNQIISHLMNGIWESLLLTELYQEDGEAVEFQAHLTHVVGNGI